MGRLSEVPAERSGLCGEIPMSTPEEIFWSFIWIYIALAGSCLITGIVAYILAWRNER